MTIHIPRTEAEQFVGAVKAIINDIVKQELGDGMMGDIGTRIESAVLGIAADELLKRLEAGGYITQ